MYGQNDQKDITMNLIHFDGKLYYALKPVNSLFNSILIRDVYTRGDFLACDLQTGDMTVLPGTARSIRKRINAVEQRAVEAELSNAVITAKRKMDFVRGDLAVIDSVDTKLSAKLNGELAGLKDAKNAVENLLERLDGRIGETAAAFEGVNEMRGRALTRRGWTGCEAIARGFEGLNVSAGMIGRKNSQELKDGLTLLRKLEEVFLPKEAPAAASASVSEAEGASVIEEAAPVAKPRAKRVRKNAASKE